MVAADDTIAHIATAAGGGVGIIRISGPEAFALLAEHFRGLPQPWESRRMYFGRWENGEGVTLDEGLAVLMPGPNSYTGEDVAELHLHGGALSLQRSVEVCFSGGARPAEPGEFSRRAFLNGRIDLTRAEAISDLISARTDRALEQARAHLGGGLYDRAIDARERLLQLRARLEANIDFSEEDLPPIAPEGLASDASELAMELGSLAATFEAGRLLREGARVAIVGPPNAGKSSLLNALSRQDRVIVTEVPGTTRDTVEVEVEVEGVPITLVDTAGIRDTDDPVEQEGILRARRAVASSDLVLSLVDPVSGMDETIDAPRVLGIRSQVDRHPPAGSEHRVLVSAETGQGLDELRLAMVEALGGQVAQSGLTIGRLRHREGLSRAAGALDRAVALLRNNDPPELVAVDLQDAMDALGELVGLTTIEDVLDRLFSTFCIGK